MRGLRARVLLAVVCLAAALLRPSQARAQEGDGPDAHEALRSQVRLWLDLGEHGWAVALTRRAAGRFDDDVAWHVARLEAWHAAGMDPWIDATYTGPRDRDATERLARAVWDARQDDTLPLDGLPPRWRLMVALQRGEETAARAALSELVGAEGVAVPWSAAVCARWPDKDCLDGVGDAVARGLPPRLLAPLWTDDGPRGPLRRARRDVRRALGAWVEAHGDPARVMVAELALAVADKDWLEVLQTGGAGVDRAPLQPLFDALAGPLPAWSHWSVPRRPRWNDAMLDAAARALSTDRALALPWLRRDEAVRLGAALAERLDARGRHGAADRVRAATTPACGRRAAPYEALAEDDVARAKREAQEALWACAGTLDLRPGLDPAGLDVPSRLTALGRAWADFAEVARVGGWTEREALAASLAAWLEPSEERVLLARAASRAAGWSEGRLLDRAELLERLASAPWMEPNQALAASRADRLEARTAAFLDPTGPRLQAAVPPVRGCVPTLRPRCKLAAGVAAEAYRRRGEPVPASLASLEDRGARRAAPDWHAALEAAWFSRTSTVRRLQGTARDVDLDEALSRVVRPVEGRPAPRFRDALEEAAPPPGQVVVLSFWASWCGPCLAEFPLIDGLAGRWAADDLPVTVLSVNVDTSTSSYRRGLSKVTWQHLEVVRAVALKDRFEVDTLPTVAVIDAEGVLRALHVGYEDTGLGWLDEVVRTWADLASAP